MYSMLNHFSQSSGNLMLIRLMTFPDSQLKGLDRKSTVRRIRERKKRNEFDRNYKAICNPCQVLTFQTASTG
jgi:hypothetical protein